MTSPMLGDVIALSAIEDVVFSSGAVGQGVAILPQSDDVVAPCSGKVTLVFPTKHAIGILSDDGVEVLIHIGMDTVELNGEGFEVFVDSGETIEYGQRLAKINRALITERGKSLVTPVVITNSADFAEISVTDATTVHPLDALMTLKK